MNNGKTAASVIVLSLMVFSRPPVKAEEKPWRDELEMSVVDTGGNTKTLEISGKNKFNYSWTKSTLELNGGGLYSEEHEKKTTEEYFANEKVTRTLVQGNYVYEKAGWDRGRLSGINDRTNFSGGLGRTFLDLPKDKLVGEFGIGYIDEEYTDLSTNKFAAGRAYAKYAHPFTAMASFSQDVEYLSNLSNGNDYLVNTETAVRSSLSTHLSLRASYTWKHNNKPGPGFGQNDAITGLALVVNY